MSLVCVLITTSDSPSDTIPSTCVGSMIKRLQSMQSSEAVFSSTAIAWSKSLSYATETSNLETEKSFEKLDVRVIAPFGMM